jgi:hypothetical protein
LKTSSQWKKVEYDGEYLLTQVELTETINGKIVIQVSQGKKRKHTSKQSEQKRLEA